MAINKLDQTASHPPAATRGSYPIPLDNATTAGFLGRTERGPVNEPVLVGSFAEYSRYFGGHFADSALSHAVHDFFLHGGRRAVVVRVTNRASRAEIEVPAVEGELRLRAKNPGRHEVLRVSIDYEQVSNDDCMFNMVVQRLSPTAPGLVEDQEIYPLVSTRPTDSRFIVEVLRDSRLVQINGPPPARRPKATPPQRPGGPMRYVAMTIAGDDGDELTDYDIVGSDRDSTGLFAFARGPGIDVLSIPLPAEQELGSAAFVAAARYCEAHRAILIWDPPKDWLSVDVAIMGARRLTFASSSVITYFPRVRPRGSQARYAGGMPASGAVAGMLAQRDRRGLWSSDEPSDYALRAVLTPIVRVDAHDAERLARSGINAFVQAGGGATHLTGDVTLGAAGAGPHSNASLKRSRLLKFILNAIEDATRSAAARPDLGTAMQRLERQLQRFCDDLYLRGGLQGKTPAQAYFVKTRYSTPTTRPAMRIGLALSEPGHFAEYAVEFDGDRAGTLQRVRALEAEQLFS